MKKSSPRITLLLAETCSTLASINHKLNTQPFSECYTASEAHLTRWWWDLLSRRRIFTSESQVLASIQGIVLSIDSTGGSLLTGDKVVEVKILKLLSLRLPDGDALSRRVPEADMLNRVRCGYA